MTATAAKPAWRSAILVLRAVWGPGLFVMLADTDAGNIITAADAGTRWGYRLAPLPLLLIPAFAIVQELAVRIGLFTGRGFGDLIRLRCRPTWRIIAAMSLGVCTLGSLITELTGDGRRRRALRVSARSNGA